MNINDIDVSSGKPRHSQTRQPLSGEPRVRVRVSTSTGGLTYPGLDAPLENGTQDYVVPASTVEKMRADVEPDADAIERAKRLVERHKAAFLHERSEAAGRQLAWEDVYNSYRPTHPTWPAAFVSNEGREPKPILALEVLEEGLPSELAEYRDLRANSDFAGPAAADASSVVMAEMLRQMDEMRRELAALKSRK